MRTRLRFIVPDEALTVRVDPQTLPDSPIDASLWDIVPKVARRSLDLGLSMPESGFHIFVAADPEVMIEDVVVSHAERFAAQMDTPGDLVYIHDFDHPEAPKPLLLPTGTGPALVEAMGDLIDGLRERMPHLVDAEDLERAHKKLSSEKMCIRDRVSPRRPFLVDPLPERLIHRRHRLRLRLPPQLHRQQVR